MESAVRACEGSLRDARTFILASENLPSPRGVALQLMDLARDPEAGIADAVRLVKSDPALSAFILRAANAARFAGAAPLADVHRAVARLGMNMVRVYAIALSMMNQHRRGRCAGFDYARYWARSLFSAIAMQKLAWHCDGFAGDEAFVLGLLARIGELAFATGAPDEYATLLRRCKASGAEREMVQRSVFGFDQNELAAVLLAQWGVATTLAEVVYWQQDPEAGGFGPDSTPYRLAGALRLAGDLADGSLAPEDAPQAASSAYLRAQLLDLDPAEVRRVAQETLEEWGDWAATIGLPRVAAVAFPETAAQ
ncbi:MAG: hypothetical protein AUK49_14370 [Betaproteobacteria bacterium CG2_30_68_42]|nr:MAG: hypothetical protein AUK49_14370 [Betaproteobacteria bacterium CG2_30_68_42]